MPRPHSKKNKTDVEKDETGSQDGSKPEVDVSPVDVLPEDEFPREETEDDEEVIDAEIGEKRKRRENTPEWFDDSKHGILNTKVRALGFFPIDKSKFSGLAKNEVIVDGIRDFARGPVEGRSITGGPVQSAQELKKSYYYSGVVPRNGVDERQIHAVYGTCWGGYKTNRDSQSFKDNNMKEEFAIKFRTDNVTCDDLAALQGKPPYQKNADESLTAVPFKERRIAESQVFSATRKCWVYDHVEKVSKEHLANIGFFVKHPDKSSVDPSANDFVDRLLRDTYGKKSDVKRVDPETYDYKNIAFRTGFHYPLHIEKDHEGNPVKDAQGRNIYKEYTSADAQPQFHFELPVRRVNPSADDFVFESGEKSQTLVKIDGQSKPVEVKKVCPSTGDETRPDVDELMEDFHPESKTRKRMMVLFKYQLVLSSRGKGAPALKMKPVKIVYALEEQDSAGGIDDF